MQASGGAIAGDYFFSLKIHQRYSATYRYITIPGGTTLKRSYITVTPFLLFLFVIPPPLHQNDAGIWTTFKFEYLERATTQNGQNTTRKTIQKLTEQQQAILVYLNEHPNATRKELCAKIPDATMGGIIHNLSRLQELGLLKRVGGRKQGYWQIIE